MLQSASLIKYL